MSAGGGSGLDALGALGALDALVELTDARVDAQLGPVSIRVAAGERIALVGRNGSGKSTLLRLVAGLASPSSGRVRVRLDRARGPLGYAPQAFRASLLPWLSVRENVALPLRAERLAPSEHARRVDRALDVVALDRALLSRRPQTLSGGEQPLVVLARAVVARPAVLLLDEPCSALDAVARGTVRRALGAWLAASGATLLLVTHDLDDLALVERALVFAKGTSTEPGAGRVVADVPVAQARAQIARLAAGAEDAEDAEDATSAESGRGAEAHVAAAP